MGVRSKTEVRPLRWTSTLRYTGPRRESFMPAVLSKETGNDSNCIGRWVTNSYGFLEELVSTPRSQGRSPVCNGPITGLNCSLQSRPT